MSLNIIPADLLNNLYFQTYSPIRGSGWGVGGLDGGGGGGEGLDGGGSRWGGVSEN